VQGGAFEFVWFWGERNWEQLEQPMKTSSSAQANINVSVNLDLAINDHLEGCSGPRLGGIGYWRGVGMVNGRDVDDKARRRD
jgi:hypothetical protein